MNRLLRHVARNGVAYLALFVALGGTSYAALSVPPGSVGAAQIRDHVIAPVKFDGRYITGNVRAWASIGANGHVFGGGGQPTVTTDAPYPGAYDLRWKVSFPRTCATTVSIDTNSKITEHIPVQGNPSAGFVAGYGVPWTVGGKRGRVIVYTFNQTGQLTPLGFNVAVIC
jgi:hypothetical protein